MSTINTARMTAQQFLLLGEDPPGVRLELVNGDVLVSPSPIPEHSYVVIKLISLLDHHIESNQLGELHEDVDTILNRFTVRRPDVLFFWLSAKAADAGWQTTRCCGMRKSEELSF